ncbi:MAG TPA: redoxin domain-containing protein [Candidatus Polarisedimenticolia bacterium]|jgi:peroxiredoxin
MRRLRVLISAVICAALALAGVGRVARGSGPSTRVEPGSRFTPMKVMALMPDDKTPHEITLAASLGRRPVVICYFAAGEPLGEEGLLSLQELAEGDLKGKVDFFGVVKIGGKVSVAAASGRQSLLGVTLPLIIEEGFTLGDALGVTSAPSISVIDAAGVLRIPDARSLGQQVAPGLTVRQAIRDAALGRQIPTIGKLPRYYPANELTGGTYPDFMLRKLKSTERLKLSEVIDRNSKEKKITVVMFWHPNCKHCKTAMPGIVAGYRTYGKWLDIVSVTALKNADEVRNAEDTIRAHGMTFPVLEDEGRRVTELYKVVSTPTLFFIRPDGKIDSVYTTGEVNFLPIFSAKLRSILGVASQLRGAGSGS